MVTVGFCAILIGLGVDFAILIFGRYQQARDEGVDHTRAMSESIANLGRAIFFGALTTAVGFLALLLAGSAGFTQLGVLIAIGISLAGLFMTTVFFLLIPRHIGPRHGDWIFTLAKITCAGVCDDRRRCSPLRHRFWFCSQPLPYRRGPPCRSTRARGRWNQNAVLPVMR